jgi:adenosine/AMP kinase
MAKNYDMFSVNIDIPSGANVILGQSHFIKTVEDLHEVMVNAVPGARFGLAFCEASGDRLVRHSGSDAELENCAVKNARAIGAGHSFIVVMKDCYPINVLNGIKNCPEVCRIFCATSNPVEVLLIKTYSGRAIIGVVDGATPLGVETEIDIQARKELMRKFGYKM